MISARRPALLRAEPHTDGATSCSQGGTAVDEQRGAVDVGGVVREEPGHQRGDLLRAAEAAGGNLPGELLDRSPASSRTVSPSIVPGATAFTVTP